jgi:hypothetical protein
MTFAYLKDGKVEYPPVTHRIPACFMRKIELDKEWPELLLAPVVDMREFKLLRGELLVTRDRCADHIKRQRGGTGGSMG